jgi:hypothetical protein
LMGLDLLVGSGGVLSHAPRRQQSMQMMIDAFEPEGVTRLAVDSIFMMPHLGVLSSVDENAALEVFEHDCMVYLGTCVAPRRSGGTGGKDKPGAMVLGYEIDMPDGSKVSGELSHGDLVHVPHGDDETATIRLLPARGWDTGAGAGKEHEATLYGGVVGLVLDGRGRPIGHAESRAEQVSAVAGWNKATDQYP